ncbi:MAG: hypothetical protein FJZ96_04970 [Chloroflexi bacterium]|nr:hypothetical protein [Chloroflexota bacterium]
MRKAILLVFLLAILLPVAPVRAQESIRFSLVEVELWPEYDRPEMLVIYRLYLPPTQSLPLELALSLPAGVQVNAVAVMDGSGTLLTAPHQYEEQPTGRATLTFTATSGQAQVEYYAPLPRQDSARHYDFQWPSDYAVDAMTIFFKLPVEASSLQSDPVLASLGASGDGLAYYSLSAGRLDAGQVFDLSIDYQKSTDRLSVSGLQVEPVAPLDEGGSAGILDQPWLLPVGIGILGLLLVIAAVFLAGSLAGRRSGGPSRRARHTSHWKEETEPGAEAYCHACGRRAQPGDVFCRACGIRLRRGE